MDIIEIAIRVVVTLAIIGIVAYIIYTPYWAIMNFIDKVQPRRTRNSKGYRRTKTRNYNHLIITFESIIIMLTKIAKSDGVISEPEADVIKDSITHFLTIADGEGLNATEISKLRQLLVQAHNKAKITNHPISTYARKLVNYDFYLKDQVIKQLVFMASIDGYTHLKESLIFNAGETLGFHPSQIRRYINDILGFKQKSPKSTSSYEILGCKPTDDDTTIKKKYRELVKRYHPDFIQAKEHDESSVEFSKQKMQEINSAYDALKKQRGI